MALSDDTGAREHASAYEPFGAERPIKASLVPAPSGALPALPLPTLSGADQPFRFTGEYLDDDTGLYDLRARLYDPTLGRFTTLDPLEPLAGEPDTSAYAYVNNRPTVMVDPTGMRGQSPPRLPLHTFSGAVAVGPAGDRHRRKFSKFLAILG